MPCEWCDSPEAEEVEDPFLRDVYDEIVLRWFCENCFSLRWDEI